MEKKETAVEWLYEQLEDLLELYASEWTGVDKAFEQARQMEKEQIIEAHGIKTFKDCKQGIDFWTQKGGEKYYNETYGGIKC